MKLNAYAMIRVVSMSFCSMRLSCPRSLHICDANAIAETNAEKQTQELNVKQAAKTCQKILLCLRLHLLHQFGV